MKTLRINVITMVVFCLMTQLPASEPDEAIALNTVSSAILSYEPINTKIQVITPVPLRGYSTLKKNIEYPEFARMAGIEPSVTVRAYIDANGLVRECQMIRGPEDMGFEEIVIKAVRNTQWTPATYDGIAAPSNLDITFQFKLYD